MKNKFIRSLLIAVLCAGLFPITAFAYVENDSNAESVEISEAGLLSNAGMDESGAADAGNDTGSADSGSTETSANSSADTDSGTGDTGSGSDTASSAALTPEGNLTLVDDIVSDSGKQFITVVTRSGNYFYIIIDRDNSGNDNVYFLNQVDEYDLTSLMDDDEAAEYEAMLAQEEEDEIRIGEDDTDTGEDEDENSESEESEETEEIETGEEESSTKRNILPYVVVILVLAAGVGYFAYTKLKKGKKKSSKPDPDDDYAAGEVENAEDYREYPEDDEYLDDIGEDTEEDEPYEDDPEDDGLI